MTLFSFVQDVLHNDLAAGQMLGHWIGKQMKQLVDRLVGCILAYSGGTDLLNNPKALMMVVESIVQGLLFLCFGGLLLSWLFCCGGWDGYVQPYLDGEWEVEDESPSARGDTDLDVVLLMRMEAALQEKASHDTTATAAASCASSRTFCQRLRHCARLACLRLRNSQRPRHQRPVPE